MKSKSVAVMAVSTALTLSLAGCGGSIASTSGSSGKTSEAASSVPEESLEKLYSDYIGDSAIQNFKNISNDAEKLADALQAMDLESAKEAKAEIDKKCDAVINLKVDDRIASTHEPLVQAAKSYQSGAQYYTDAIEKMASNPTEANVLIDSGTDKINEVSAYMHSAKNALVDLKKRVAEEQ